MEAHASLTLKISEVTLACVAQGTMGQSVEVLVSVFVFLLYIKSNAQKNWNGSKVTRAITFKSTGVTLACVMHGIIDHISAPLSKNAVSVNMEHNRYIH